MAERLTDSPVPRRRGARPAGRIALIYLAARLVTTGFLLLASALSGPESRFGADPGIAAFILGWDAQWYWLVAVEGYPGELPLTGSNEVAENSWAFLPLYPLLSWLIGRPLGAWGVGAFVVTLVAGYLCCLALHRLVRERIGEQASLWAVAFLAAGPLAALFQVAYAEALFLFFLLLALGCVQARRYPWLYLLVPLLGFTRPGVLAFALFLGLFGIWRLLNRRREPLRMPEVLHILALGALATLVGFSWQVIAAVVTGDPNAYLATELAWRRNWVSGEGGFVPFEGWFQGAEFWAGSVWGLGPGWGTALAVGLIAGAAAVLIFEPHVRRLGMETRLWSASYLLYLLAVFFPQSSLFRLLMPLSPLWGAAAVPRRTSWRIGVLAVCLVGQWWWIWNMYGLGSAYWQVP